MPRTPDREGIRFAILSRKGNCYDNAVVESFFDSLKTEEVADRLYRSQEETRRSIIDFIVRFYNPRQRHSSLGGINLIEFEKLTTTRAQPTQRRWQSRVRFARSDRRAGASSGGAVLGVCSGPGCSPWGRSGQHSRPGLQHARVLRANRLIE